MSNYERNKMVLKPVSESLEAVAERAVDCIPKWHESKLDAFQDEPEIYGHTIIDGACYEVDRLDCDDDPEYCHIRKREDGSFEIETYHYNGGAHWTELLEGKLK